MVTGLFKKPLELWHRLRGPRYIVYPLNGALCHRVHRPWCPNVKRRSHSRRRHPTFFYSVEDLNRKLGEDWFECFACGDGSTGHPYPSQRRL